MNLDSKIYIAGHNGMVGTALLRRLKREGFCNLVYRDSKELDLTKTDSTDAFFEAERPEYVFLAAAKVGGIHANETYPADFIRINLQIQTNVIDAAQRFGVKKLLFLSSSCVYPKLAPQPMKEEYLLTGKLEPTNDAYAIAKIAGMFMCRSYNRQHDTNFISATSTNLFGPGDNFDSQTAHALPTIIRKFHQAKLQGNSRVELWGSGTPRREWMYVDDCAEALVFMMQRFNATPELGYLNVGIERDLTMKELAGLVMEIVGFDGDVHWDTSMPDGTPRKLVDVTRLRELGWSAKTSLDDGIRKTYAWFLDNCQYESKK